MTANEKSQWFWRKKAHLFYAVSLLVFSSCSFLKASYEEGQAEGWKSLSSPLSGATAKWTDRCRSSSTTIFLTFLPGAVWLVVLVS